MKTIATGRMNQAAVRYSEHAPLVATCCNVCRTCVTSNVLALGWAAIVGAALAVAAFFRRDATP